MTFPLDIQGLIPPEGERCLIGMFLGSSHTEPQFRWPWMSRVYDFGQKLQEFSHTSDPEYKNIRLKRP